MRSVGYSIVCACLLIGVVGGVRLYVQPTVFYENDRNVRMICANVSHSTKAIKSILQMSIEVLGDQGIWKDVAVVSSGSTVVNTIATNISATGKAGNVTTSHLTITWPVVTSDHFGRYRCEVVGYTDSHELQVEKSLNLVFAGVPNENSQLYEYIARSDRSLLREVDESLITIMKENLDAIARNVKTGRQSSISKVTSDLVKKLADLETNITQKVGEAIAEKSGNELMWPEGNFILLMPDTLCPSNPSSWKAGYLQQRTQDKGTTYTMPALHMAQPMPFGDSFLFQRFCSLESSPDRQGSWPSGTYCINQFGASCPSGFETSTLKYDLKDSSSATPVFGSVPMTVTTRTKYVHYIHYCCRHDGSPDTPISLPFHKPFYLYQHRGTCQRVENMDVLNDAFRLTTASDDRGDSWTAGTSDFRPDIDIKPVFVRLCYYVKTRYYE